MAFIAVNDCMFFVTIALCSSIEQFVSIALYPSDAGCLVFFIRNVPHPALYKPFVGCTVSPFAAAIFDQFNLMGAN